MNVEAVAQLSLRWRVLNLSCFVPRRLLQLDDPMADFWEHFNKVVYPMVGCDYCFDVVRLFVER